MVKATFRRSGLFTKRNLLGLVPFALIVAFIVTCVITYPDLIPHSLPFDLERLPFCDREFVEDVTFANHNSARERAAFRVLLWTRGKENADLDNVVDEEGRPVMCDYRNCVFSDDRRTLESADALVFDDADLDADDLPPPLRPALPLPPAPSGSSSPSKQLERVATPHVDKAHAIDDDSSNPQATRADDDSDEDDDDDNDSAVAKHVTAVAGSANTSAALGKKTQRWVYLSRVPPPMQRLNSRFDGLFNWTMSYSRTADDVHVPAFSMCRRQRRPAERDAVQMAVASKRFAAIWFVDSCRSTNLAYVSQLQLELPVHIVGPCSPQGFSCSPNARSTPGDRQRRVAEQEADDAPAAPNEAATSADSGRYDAQVSLRRCMDSLMPLYRFALVFEDALCNDYLGSQLRDVLRYDVIPIVWGGAHYSEILPKESFVAASEYGRPKELLRQLYRFRSDQLFARAVNARRGVYAERVSWPCRLCEALNRHQFDPPIAARKRLASERRRQGRCRVWRQGFFRSWRPNQRDAPVAKRNTAGASSAAADEDD